MMEVHETEVGLNGRLLKRWRELERVEGDLA